MTRCLGGLLSFLVALPLFARVISYAPYTNRVAEVSIQSRTARHFVLLEADAKDYKWRDRSDVVLYDSTGAEEPRVITPRDGVWYQSALYQKQGAAPVILLLGDELGPPYSAHSLWLSDGGTSWRKVEVPVSIDWTANLDVDTGGPFTTGLFAPIAIGNDAWPFVMTLRGQGVWAISRGGTARKLFDAGARVIGRNAAGDRFLVVSNDVLWSTAVDGPPKKLVELQMLGTPFYAGWLTKSGVAYLEVLNHAGRYLFLAGDGGLNFIAGTYDSIRPGYGTYPNESLPLRFFAVPTHDYEGAWMVRRGPGRPTTLLRHEPGSGLQTMWADASAPQVEALLPGASGETLLVQVHRERAVANAVSPLIDPALAVWRVGQPAPRAYEELYLNESWNKGFVIVDPDTIESGTPFVFNSGFVEIVEEPVSRVSAPIGGGSDVMQEWGIVRGSFRQRLVLPGVARLRGAYESFWQSDVTIYNPLEERQQVEARFVPLGTQDPVSVTLTLEPRELRAIPDVVKTLFSIDDGGGALHLFPEIGVNAFARNYSRRSDGGTFGFGMNAIDAFSAAGPRFPMSFAGAFPGDRFRTNLLLTDTSGRGASVDVHAHGATGRLQENGVQMTAPAQRTVQVSSVDTTTRRPAGGGGLVLEATRGSVIATVVAIDNGSNDPTYFPPDLPGAVARVIPVIGHVDGANGAHFRTDLYLYNPRNTTRDVDLTVQLWGAPPARPRGARLTLWPRESRVIRDVMSYFGLKGMAHLYVANPSYQTGDAVRVTSRAYTTGADGSTYGCLVPPLNGFQIATAGERLEILGISAGPGFRTNVGLVDLSSRSQRDPLVRVTIVGDGGRVLHASAVHVPARGGLQLDDIFSSLGTTPPPAALLIVEVLEGQQIAAYATLTDNTTNDSTYLASQLGAKEEEH